MLVVQFVSHFPAGFNLLVVLLGMWFYEVVEGTSGLFGLECDVSPFTHSDGRTLEDKCGAKGF